MANAGVKRHRHERHAGEQKNQREAGKQNIERDFVGRFLPRRAFDQRDHAIEKRFAGTRRDAHDDAVGQHFSAAGDRRTIAAAFANDRSRFAGDRRFIDRGDALDHVAVAGNNFAGFDDDGIAFAQSRRGHCFFAVAVEQAPRGGFLAHLAQRRRLGLTAAFGNRFGEVGENHREPQPEAHVEGEPQRLRSGCRSDQVAQQDQSREHAADLDDEHDRIFDHVLRHELAEALPDRRPHNFRIEKRTFF